MKVISLLQPWATLVVIGAKKIETRSWNTKHRGDLLIHASKKMGEKQEELISSEPFWSALKHLEELHLGKIIGKVKVTETKTSENLFSSISNQEASFGDYTKDRYGWLLTEPQVLKHPISINGNRGLWSFPMCLQCGCWDHDACVHPKHGNCWWEEEDLCSHCKLYPGESERHFLELPRMVKHDNSTGIF